MKKYFALFRMRFVHTLQYRSAAFAGILTQFVWGIMEILAFHAFFRQNPSAFPISFEQTVAYIWLQQAFLSLFMLWFFENDLFSAISSGAIAYEFARPLDIYFNWFSRSCATRLAKACLRCAPILVVAFFLPKPYNLVLPTTISHFLLFFLSLTLSLGVVVAISMFVYTATFYTLSPIGIRIIAAITVEFLSGGTVPLPFFPESIRSWVERLPFASIQNTPLMIYGGQYQGLNLVNSLFLQVFWLVTLTSIGYLWMTHSLKKVIVQGG